MALREQRTRTGLAGEAAAPGALPLAEPRRLLPVQPRTMVEQAAEAIVGAAARGVFLPGDRLVEAEIARDLGISRVPVREALRLLESQGIVVSTPYKGMRLMQVSNAGVAELLRVRLALETLAVQEALCNFGDVYRCLWPQDNTPRRLSRVLVHFEYGARLGGSEKERSKL